MTKLFSFLFILIFFKLNFAFSESLVTSTEKYWNSINSMTGQFKQINSDGKTQYGNFYLKKPHKSLFEYNDQEEKILTTKFFLHIINQKHFILDSYPISSSPIKFLFLENLNLQKHFDVVSYDATDQITIELSENGETNNMEKFTLYFNKKSLDLEKWEIFNEFGEKTSLEFTNILKNISISADKFVIHYNNTDE
jgi:outer membrane lipoprotein-sorting protein